MKFFQNAIGYAAIASFLYGANAPLMKASSTAGASPSGMLFFYGIGSIIVSLWVYFTGNTPMFKNTLSMALSAPMGIICGLAFLYIGYAFKLPGGSVMLITTFIAAHSIVAVPVEAATIGRFANVNWPYFLFGTLVVLAGVYIVTKSIRA